MICVRTLRNVAVSRLRAYEFGMSHVCMCATGADWARGSGMTLDGSRTERGLQVVEEESVVFSTTEVGDKHAGPSGLGDLEVYEGIYHSHTPRRGQLEREDGGSVHLATTKAKLKPD